MNRVRCIAYPLLLLICSSVPAETQSEIAEAARPIDEGVPEVAVERLQNLSRRASAKDRQPVQEKLGEALLAAKRPADALRVLEQKTVRDSATAKFLRGQALAELRRYADALSLYGEVAADARAPQRSPAAFGVAEMFRALQRTDEAIAQYRRLENDGRFGVAARLRQAELLLEKRDLIAAKRVLDATEPKEIAQKREKRLLRGRLELANGHAEKAIELLESLGKKSEGATRATVLAALFAAADAHLQLGTPEAGDDYLEEFIDRHPNDVELARVMAKLDQLYRAEHKPPRIELERWSRDSAQPRRGLARWYLAQIDLRAGRREEALRHLEDVRHNANATVAPALLFYARLLIGQARFDDALALLREAQRLPVDADMRAQLDFEAGRATYGHGVFVESSQHFEQIAGTGANPASAAIFNASLAWLQAGEEKKSAAAAQALQARGDANGAEEVLLERGISAARRNDGSAATVLQQFIERSPNHPRVSEAYIALAEIAYHAAPPRLEEADKNLAAARKVNPTDMANEGADYLAIWLADARAIDSDRVIALANDFLRAHPQSELVREVRLKLAETHFRRQDFANAQTQFELLGQENPNSALSEKALFFAAQSAMSNMTPHALDRALELFAQVIRAKGELQWASRNEQAAIERRLGKPQEAQLLYDEVLKGNAKPTEKREALCGKADALVEQATKDPANLAQAVAAYDQLAVESANQPHWRNQGLFKKGVCQEKQSQADAALSTFYSILEFNPQPEKPPEIFWFYKAGFNAARLLETQEKWQSAAAVYDRLVTAGGPRSDEAKARLSQLRLEHFLW
jgi:outer membrane protein assembly factor BamD (BamD/ComL family)